MPLKKKAPKTSTPKDREGAAPQAPSDYKGATVIKVGPKGPSERPSESSANIPEKEVKSGCSVAKRGPERNLCTKEPHLDGKEKCD